MAKVKHVLEKKVGDLDVVIHETLLNDAFKHDFQSLMFDSGEVFLEVSGKEGQLLLETNGHVTIFDIEKEVKICDEKRFSDKKLMKLIEKGEIYGSPKYEIDENNWFAAVYFKKDKDGSLISVDDVLIEDIPSSLDELIKDMVELYEYFSERS